MNDEDVIEESAEPGISRRTLIKGAAIVGGTVWVAPVIDSFVTKAAAASTPCAGASTCGTGVSCSGPASGCIVYCTSESTLFCGELISCQANQCTTGSDCTTGWACVPNTNDCCSPFLGGTCIPPCGTDPPAGTGPTTF